ncbi:hypothetical protein CDIK_2659 [Cucumispora dikerogammari]|nr:hypothetical protein CDIK_2659 [Cucumispora dikerogammari]
MFNILLLKKLCEATQDDNEKADPIKNPIKLHDISSSWNKSKSRINFSGKMSLKKSVQKKEISSDFAELDFNNVKCCVHFYRAISGTEKTEGGNGFLYSMKLNADRVKSIFDCMRQSFTWNIKEDETNMNGQFESEIQHQVINRLNNEDVYLKVYIAVPARHGLLLGTEETPDLALDVFFKKILDSITVLLETTPEQLLDTEEKLALFDEMLEQLYTRLGRIRRLHSLFSLFKVRNEKDVIPDTASTTKQKNFEFNKENIKFKKQYFPSHEFLRALLLVTKEKLILAKTIIDEQYPFQDSDDYLVISSNWYFIKKFGIENQGFSENEKDKVLPNNS